MILSFSVILLLGFAAFTSGREMGLQTNLNVNIAKQLNPLISQTQ